MTTEIKPCPVCSSEALLWRTVVANPGEMIIRCRNRNECGITLGSRRIEGVWETEEELAARWNALSRATAQPTAQMSYEDFRARFHAQETTPEMVRAMETRIAAEPNREDIFGKFGVGEDDARRIVMEKLGSCPPHSHAEQAVEMAKLRAEIDRLRAALAKSKSDCAYCGLPAEEWAECRSGFPGCARADDANLCPELGTAMAASAEASELRAEIERLRQSAAEEPWLACKNCGAEHDDENKEVIAELLRLRARVEEFEAAAKLNAETIEAGDARIAELEAKFFDADFKRCALNGELENQDALIEELKDAVKRNAETFAAERARTAELERVVENHLENVYLIKIVGQIREASGVGVKPMLDELPGAIKARIEESGLRFDVNACAVLNDKR
jgi:hypothetical protein